MTPLAVTDRLFFERADAALDRAAAEARSASALARSDDGELYLEYRESEQISLDDGRIRSAGLRHLAGLRPARRGRRGDRLRACRRTVGTGAAPGRRQRGGGGGRPFRRRRRAAAGHQCAALLRRQPAGRRGFPRPHRAAGRNRRLCAGQGSARRAGDGLDRRRVAGGADHARRRHAGRRSAAAGAAERRGRGRAGRPARDWQLRHRRPLRLRPCHRARGMARRGRRGAAPGAGQPRQRARAGRRDGGRARPRLAGHPAA